MNPFLLFFILLNFFESAISFFVALFLWKNLREDYGYRILSLILFSISLMVFLMGLRILLEETSLISEGFALKIFIFYYTILILTLFLIALPGAFYLVLNKKIAKRIGFFLGFILFSIHLLLLIKEGKNLRPIPTLYGPLFELPTSFKFQLFISVGLLFCLAIYRSILLILKRKKEKISFYRLYSVFSLFFVFLSSFPFFFTLRTWHCALGLIGIIAGTLAIYFFALQEKISKEMEFQ
jgi:hypothetical protein